MCRFFSTLAVMSANEDGWCQYQGQRMRIADVPESAWQLPVYDNVSGTPTGETVGDLVKEWRKRDAANDRWETFHRGWQKGRMKQNRPNTHGTNATIQP